ncbi:MAG: 4'-phosphopantetheinyl transferase superfamily protein [Vampirovibrionales bacterium]|nr:4'-phosphopantetheinyl transferase superfamily protein [Vampirovibrionales bacterium]
MRLLLPSQSNTSSLEVGLADSGVAVSNESAPHDLQLHKPLKDWLEQSFGRSFTVVATDLECAEDDLLPIERHTYQGLGAPRRKTSWIKGRKALKMLCSSIVNQPAGFFFQGNIDTGLIPFPHPRISITHSGNLAIAVYLEDTETASDKTPLICGIGIDYQVFRPIRNRSWRMFLTVDEQAWVSSQPEPEIPKELIRLWTIKEALYKANPANNGTRYVDYHLVSPEQSQGDCVFKGTQERRLQYASIPFEEGYLSLALALSEVIQPEASL